MTPSNPAGQTVSGSPFGELSARLGDSLLVEGLPADGIPTAWVARERLHEALAYFKREVERPYRMLFDLTAVDERMRVAGRPPHDFTVVYQLFSLERGSDVRLKVACPGEPPSLPSLTSLWPAANWYEREIWDMFGIHFEGHPDLRRILLPLTWVGHPLRKDHPARATEAGPFQLAEARKEREMEAMRFRPEEWGQDQALRHGEEMYLNVGPQHPGTHGVLRVVLRLDGEQIVDAVPDIGFHHRAAEKMGERQTWHKYIPYTDRVDYLAGSLNELPYLLGVEKLAGIEVPDRAKLIRILLCELFRIANHLVWYGTFAQDVGALSPVFYMFNDREKILEVVEAVTGARMHPGWFRIGGVADDLPQGWQGMVQTVLEMMPRKLREYDRMVMKNSLFQRRTRGIGVLTLEQAVEWGVTGPNLRACGLAWDLRKARPYGGYDQLEFEIPSAEGGDCYARAQVRIEEVRQSLRIIEQCVREMPSGPYKADHPLTTPPIKDRTMHDIETLIHHFLGVSWGPVIPPGECMGRVESSKGLYSYYLISDGGPQPYRVRIRTASFPHMQTVPLMSRGLMVSDLLAILGSIDFVLSDVDR
jgi:NADH-quinone oxidoreductase subunit C/D